MARRWPSAHRKKKEIKEVMGIILSWLRLFLVGLLKIEKKREEEEVSQWWLVFFFFFNLMEKLRCLI